MKQDKAFCVECMDEVEFHITEKSMTHTFKIKGKNIKCDYRGKEANCTICKSEVYVAEINDYNLEKLYEVFNEKKGELNV